MGQEQEDSKSSESKSTEEGKAASPMSANLANLLKATRRAAKTLLEPKAKACTSDGAVDGGSAAGTEAPKAEDQPAGADAQQDLKDLMKATKKTARTMLDPRAMNDVVARSTEEKEKKLAEELENRPKEPFKPFIWIDKYRRAAQCEQSWKEVNCEERVRQCKQCGLSVYDFTGMELPQAADLVEKTENRTEFVLYRRKDGKFLTKNCPVGTRNKYMMVVLAVASSSTLLGVMMLSKQSDGTTTGGGSDGQSITYNQDQGNSPESPGAAAAPWLSQGAVGASRSKETTELVNFYGRQVERYYRSVYSPPANVKKSEDKVVIRIRLSNMGSPLGYAIMQSSGDVDVDQFALRSAINQQFPAPPAVLKSGVMSELTFSRGEVEVKVF